MNFTTFTETIPFAFVFFNEDGHLQESSPSFEARFGKHSSSTHFETIFKDHSDWLNKLKEIYTTHLHYHFAEDAVEMTPILNNDHSLKGVACYFYPFEKSSLLKAQKSRSESLKRMKLIAKGLAHEIRNPLASLKGAAQLLMDAAPNAESHKTYCDIIIRETDRVNRLVSNLMELSQNKPLEKSHLNIHKPLRHALETINISTQDSIRIVENFDPSLPEILGHADALEQIFINLLKNAVEALVDHPKQILVKTYAANDFSLKTENRKQKMLCIDIQDNGQGLSDSDLQKIFTPYYSTKNQGSGLGLTLTNDLVEKHGGTLTIQSKEGAGSIFSVYLPL